MEGVLASTLKLFDTQYDTVVAHISHVIMQVGLPVFFEPGSPGQLMFGLLVCFITITFFAYHRPSRDVWDDYIQLLCLVEVFFLRRRHQLPCCCEHNVYALPMVY